MQTPTTPSHRSSQKGTPASSVQSIFRNAMKRSRTTTNPVAALLKRGKVPSPRKCTLLDNWLALKPAPRKKLKVSEQQAKKSVNGNVNLEPDAWRSNVGKAQSLSSLSNRQSVNTGRIFEPTNNALRSVPDSQNEYHIVSDSNFSASETRYKSKNRFVQQKMSGDASFKSRSKANVTPAPFWLANTSIPHNSFMNNRPSNELLRKPDIIDMTFLSNSDDSEDDFDHSSTCQCDLCTSRKSNKGPSKLKSSERNISPELDKRSEDTNINFCNILDSSDSSSDDDEDQEDTLNVNNAISIHSETSRSVSSLTENNLDEQTLRHIPEIFIPSFSTTTTNTSVAETLDSDMTYTGNDVRNEVVNSVSSFVDETGIIDPIYRIGAINEQNDSGCYSLLEFEKMWESALEDMGSTLEELEEGSCVRKANNKIDTAVSSNQSKAQYGRIFFKSTFNLFKEEWNLHRKDVFLDIGHGIGNAPLLAAYTVGCESRGIEVIADRNLIADSLKRSIEKLRDVHRSVHDRCASVGNVIFQLGRLEDPNNRDFLISIPCSYEETEDDYKGATKVLVNNYNGVFSDRSAKSGQVVYLDHYVAGLFALMVPGSIMITLHPLNMPQPRSVVEENRAKQGLPTGDTNASFYEFEQKSIGQARDHVSWAGGGCKTDIHIYKYTRLKQQSSEPVFLCSTATCSNAKSNVPIAATKEYTNRDGEVGTLLVSCCERCNIAQKNLRPRKEVEYRTP